MLTLGGVTEDIAAGEVENRKTLVLHALEGSGGAVLVTKFY